MVAVGGAKRVDELPKYERHERLRKPVGDGSDGADHHENKVEPVRKDKQLEEGHLLVRPFFPTVALRLLRRIFIFAHGSAAISPLRKKKKTNGPLMKINKEDQRKNGTWPCNENGISETRKEPELRGTGKKTEGR